MGKNILKKYVKKLIGGDDSSELNESEELEFETASEPNEINENNIRLFEGMRYLKPKFECRLGKGRSGR